MNQKKMISAEIIADSKNIQGDRITTFILTFPRFILAELNTHRVFSKNSASSRAIPFEKMVQNIIDDPFIPIAFQKSHKGMQGNEYWKDSDILQVTEDSTMPANTHFKNEWLAARDAAVLSAKHMHEMGLTKQLCNRILEPFAWHTVILSGTEFENFFKLRGPKYKSHPHVKVTDKFTITSNAHSYHKTKESWMRNYALNEESNVASGFTIPATPLEWLKHNVGASEIHMMALAEAMHTEYEKSEPKLLRPRELHIPFGNNLDYDKILWNCIQNYKKEFPNEDPINDSHSWDIQGVAAKIAIARCARVSYLNFEGKDDYNADLKLYDRLKKMQHFSPFEHVARAMTEDEYESHRRGKHTLVEMDYYDLEEKIYLHRDGDDGWCRNFKGFIQERVLIDGDD
jgi:hypothetical protein